MLYVIGHVYLSFKKVLLSVLFVFYEKVVDQEQKNMELVLKHRSLCCRQQHYI